MCALHYKRVQTLQYTVFVHLIVLHFLFYCTFYSLFLFFTYIYALVLCYFYIIFIFILLHCPLSGPDLIYISLLIIPCIIYYVTNKETLNREQKGGCKNHSESNSNPLNLCACHVIGPNVYADTITQAYFEKHSLIMARERSYKLITDYWCQKTACTPDIYIYIYISIHYKQIHTCIYL